MEWPSLIVAAVAALLIGVVVVPAATVVLAGNARRGAWPFVLPLAGAAIVALLWANILDVSAWWGRVGYAVVFVALVLVLITTLFLISQRSGSDVALEWIGRAWLLAAAALLLTEIGFRVFPAYDSLALNPGVKFFWPDWVSFKLNNFGHRDRHFSPAKPAGTYRILLLGDSFTEGAGLARPQTFGRILEHSLTAALGGTRKVEVYNLGHAGANTQDEAAILLRDGSALQPDLVVLNYVFNDAEMHPVEVPYSVSPPWVLPFHDAFLTRLRSYAYYWMFTRISFTRPGFASAIEYYRMQHDPRGRGWAGVVAALDAMQAWLEKHGVPGLALVWPVFIEAWPAGAADLREQVIRELRRHRIEPIDLLPELLRIDPQLQRFALSGIDAHPNAEAHAVAASVLTRLLRARLP